MSSTCTIAEALGNCHALKSVVGEIASEKVNEVVESSSFKALFQDAIMECLSDFFADEEVAARCIRTFDGFLKGYLEEFVIDVVRRLSLDKESEFERIENVALEHLRDRGYNDEADKLQEHIRADEKDRAKKRYKDAVFMSLARYNEWSMLEDLERRGAL